MSRIRSLTLCLALAALCSCGPAPEEVAKMVHQHAAAGNAKQLAPLLKKMPEMVKHRNAANNDRTPLLESTSAAVAQLLIANGADVKAQDRLGSTALHLTRDVQIAQALLDKGADVNARDKRGRTPLHLAADEDMAALLLERGADVKAATAQHVTPLFEHISRGNEPIVRLLLEKGADVNAELPGGKSYLHLAADREQIGIVKLLLEKGLAPGAKDEVGATPLHYAVFSGRLRSAAELLKRGADPTVRLPADGKLVTIGLDYEEKEHEVGPKTPMDLAKSPSLRQIMEKYVLEKQAERAVQRRREEARRKAQKAKNAPPPPPPPLMPTDNMTGRTLAEVREVLGHPRMRIKRGTRIIINYPDREIISHDGKTVFSDSYKSKSKSKGKKKKKK